jgi:hypothetical protein
MGGVFKAIKKVVSGVVNIAKKVLSSPLLSGLASFIPVVGPFISIAAKVYQAYQAAKSGNLLGAAMSFLGGGGVGSGIGGALTKTLGDVMGKVSGLVSPNVMSFATSALGALGGNSNDVLKVAELAANTLKGTTNSTLLQGALHNSTRLTQYMQARAFTV